MRSPVSPSAITLGPATIFQRSGNVAACLSSVRAGRPDRITTGLLEKPVRDPRRQGIDNDLQRGFVRHMAVTLTVHKFGLDSQFFGFGEKVHSARGLHATAGAVREIHQMQEEDSRV